MAPRSYPLFPWTQSWPYQPYLGPSEDSGPPLKCPRPRLGYGGAQSTSQRSEVPSLLEGHREERELGRRAVMCCLLESSCLVSGLCSVKSCWLPLALKPWLLFNILPAPLMLCLAPVGLQLTAWNWSQFSVFISQCFDWRQIQFRPIRAGGNNYQVCLCLLRFGRRKWREPQNVVEELALRKREEEGSRADQSWERQ